jgi:hypothetical protein
MSVTISGDGTITGLDADGISSQPVFPGNVLQVVSANYSTQTTNNTGSYVDTGLTASITPTSASSKVLILVSQNGCYKGGSATNVIGRIQLLRGATVLAKIGDEIGDGLNSVAGLTSVSAMYLDSPATTSSTTYKTQFHGLNGSFLVQISSTVSTITLMEIAA